MTNVVVVKGCLTRPASERLLPSGDRLAVLDVTVPGVVSADGTTARAESVPAAWFGAPAWLLDLEAGAELVLVGRVRKRFFQAGGLQSRTEVVVEAGAPSRRAAKVADLLRYAAEAVAGAATGAAVVSAARTPARGRAQDRPVNRRPRRRAAPTFP
ncbi:MAG: hypothetical protein NVSMB12_19000 [Acidimicrobiales bacterium]